MNKRNMMKFTAMQVVIEDAINKGIILDNNSYTSEVVEDEMDNTFLDNDSPTSTVMNSSECEVIVPQSEMKVLIHLKQLREAIAPAIVKLAKDTISLAAIYQLLKRLERKGIVTRKEAFYELGGIETKRVFYKITDGYDVIKLNGRFSVMRKITHQKYFS